MTLSHACSSVQDLAFLGDKSIGLLVAIHNINLGRLIIHEMNKLSVYKDGTEPVS